MALETLQLEHVPPTHTVHAALFRGVANSEFLQQQLLARNTDFEYAFVDASALVSRRHALAAVFKAVALLLEGPGLLKTPNVHSETVCSLSPNNNIAEAYRRYGITPASKDLVIIKVLYPKPDAAEGPAAARRRTAEDVWQHLSANVEGRPEPFTDENVAACTDWAKVRKYYRLNGLASLDAVKDEAARKREMEMLILGSMALRGL